MAKYFYTGNGILSQIEKSKSKYLPKKEFKAKKSEENARHTITLKNFEAFIQQMSWTDRFAKNMYF